MLNWEGMREREIFSHPLIFSLFHSIDWEYILGYLSVSIHSFLLSCYKLFICLLRLWLTLSSHPSIPNLLIECSCSKGDLPVPYGSYCHLLSNSKSLKSILQLLITKTLSSHSKFEYAVYFLIVYYLASHVLKICIRGSICWWCNILVILHCESP